MINYNSYYVNNQINKQVKFVDTNKKWVVFKFVILDSFIIRIVFGLMNVDITGILTWHMDINCHP